VAATLVFSVFARDSSAPLIGASGAISGVLGAYFLWFPRHRVRLLIFLFFYVDVWRVPARWVLAFYIIVDNLLPFLAGGNGEGVAYGAHLGGFAAGLATALLLGHKPGDAASRAFGATVAAPGVGSGGGATGTTGAGAKAASAAAPGGARRGEAWVLDRSGTPVARVPAVASFVSDVRAGRYLEAGALYAQMSGPERLQQNDDLVLTLAQGLLEASSMAAALAVLQSFIAGRPRSPRLAEAHYQAAVIHLERTGRLLAAREHLHNALELGPSPALESAARRALAAVEESLRQG
jgi:hypothetical protein